MYKILSERMIVSKLRLPSVCSLARQTLKFEVCKTSELSKLQFRLSSHVVTINSDHSEVSRIPVQYGVHRQALVEKLDTTDTDDDAQVRLETGFVDFLASI